MNRYPKHWRRAKIGALSDQINGRAFKPNEWTEHGTKIIRIQNLNNPKAQFNHTVIDIEEKYNVKNGDLLFAWSGTPGTSFGAHIWHGDNAFLNQHIYNIKIKANDLDKRYYYYALKRSVNDFINQAQGTAGLAHITKKKFEDTEIPLPPLPEQKRIVAKLDTLFAHLDQLRSRLDKIPALLKQFRQAVLTQAVTGKLTGHGSKPWVKCQLADVTKLDVGNAFKSKEFESRGIRLLRGENIEPGRLRWRDTVYFPEDRLKGFSHLYINKGDVILAMDRPLISSGLKIAMAVEEDLPCVLVQRVARFRPSSDLDPGFLYLLLNSEDYANHLFGQQRGTQIPHISAKQILSYAFGLPPLKEQLAIVRRAQSIFDLAVGIESTYESVKNKIERLPELQLLKAFTGGLTDM